MNESVYWYDYLNEIVLNTLTGSIYDSGEWLLIFSQLAHLGSWHVSELLSPSLSLPPLAPSPLTFPLFCTHLCSCTLMRVHKARWKCCVGWSKLLPSRVQTPDFIFFQAHAQEEQLVDCEEIVTEFDKKDNELEKLITP